jgi:hypothetical protein
MAATCCERCGDALLDRDALRLVSIARPDGRNTRRLVICGDCAGQLVTYLTAGRGADLAAEASGAWR